MIEKFITKTLIQNKTIYVYDTRSKAKGTPGFKTILQVHNDIKNLSNEDFNELIHLLEDIKNGEN